MRSAFVGEGPQPRRPSRALDQERGTAMLPPILPDATINTIGELETFFANNNLNQVWSRGHAAAEWPLIPRLFRPNLGMANNALRCENTMRARFTLEAPSKRAGCPDFRDREGWMLLMQHYGMPTRLLDWTTSPLIALWFAVREVNCDGQDGALWLLLPAALNQFCGKGDGICVFNSPEVELLINAAWGGAVPPAQVAIAAAPRHVDVRVASQSSVLTVHSDGTPLERLHMMMVERGGSCLKLLLIPRNQ